MTYSISTRKKIGENELKKKCCYLGSVIDKCITKSNYVNNELQMFWWEFEILSIAKWIDTNEMSILKQHDIS